MSLPTAVLYVAPNEGAANVVADCFEANYPTLSLDVAFSPTVARDRLADGPVDCVVAGSNLDGTSGLSFLAEVPPTTTRILYTADDSPALVTAASDDGIDSVVHRTGEGGAHRLAEHVRTLVSPRPRVESSTDWDSAYLTDEPEPSTTTVDSPGAVQSELNRTYERMSDAVLTLDSDWRCTYLNSRAAAFLGVVKEEYLGRVLWESRPMLVDTVAEEKLREAMETQEPLSFEMQSDTSGLWFRVRVYPSETGLSVYFDDETVTKRHEHDLQQYKVMFETVNDGVYAIDAEDRFAIVNDAYTELVGYERDEILGEPASTVTKDVLPEEIQDVQATLERGEEMPVIQTEITRRDGTTVPVEARISLFPLENGERGRIGVVRDLSEHERLRSELDEVLERVTDAFFALDTEWRFTFANDRAAELIANSVEELLGESVWDLYPEAVGTTFETQYRHAMEEQEPVAFEEYFPPLSTWFQVNAYPSETGLSVYFRDVTEYKEWEERLSSLNQTMQTLLEATTRQEILDIAVEATDELLRAPTVVLTRYDETTGRLEAVPRTAEAATELDDVLLADDDAIAWQAFVENDFRVYDSLSADLGEQTAMESAAFASMGRYGVLVAASPHPDAFSENDVSVIDILATSIRSALDRADREEVLRERRDALEAQNESLDRLRRTNSVIREITGTLTQASTRKEIEEAVCNRLAAADPYRFAWIGAQEFVSGGIAPRASAGIEQEFLSAVTATANDGHDDSWPPALAATTRELQVQNTIHGDPPFDPWQEAALKRGLRSSIAVPIVHRETLYGVLCLYAGEPNVFNEMEQTVLTELGELIGHALNALERKHALVSEQSVELEFSVEDPLDQPFRFLADVDAEFDYENIVQRRDGYLHFFFTTRGIDPETVLEAGAGAIDVDHITLITAQDGECLFECAVADSTVFGSLLNRGAVPETVSMTGSEGRVVIRLPRSVEARSVVELFERKFKQVELLARREHDNPVRTQQEFNETFEENLTNRQTEVLRTAYFAGFFEWPRDSTGEEIAEMLGVSQPTVHRHIRAGERKLFSLLFDE